MDLLSSKTLKCSSQKLFTCRIFNFIWL